MTCEHRFCRNCLISEWTLKINNGQVDKTLLKCPTVSCKIEIDYHILKGNLDKKTFDKYEKFLLSHILLEASNKGEQKEKTVICPNPKCSQTFYIWEEADLFKCPQCNLKYCAKEDCKGEWKLHEGKSCQQFKALRKNRSTVQEEIMIADFEYIEKNYKKCPVCGIPIENTKNCNYVRCESGRCQKKTVFCYLCGESLNEEKIKFHYMSGNPFLGCKKLNNQDK